MSQRNQGSTQSDYGATHWLIHQAAKRAPDLLSSRLEEEWLADLESRTTVLSRLGFALGCCWASVVILNEQPRRRVAVASSATTAKGFIVLPDRGFGYFSLRSGTLFLIAGLHAALFYGLITSLANTHHAVIPPNLQNYTIVPVPPETFTPPPTGMTAKDWTIKVKDLIRVVPREVNVEGEMTTQVEKAAEPYSPPGTGEPLAPVIKRVAGGPGAGFPDTRDFYPPPSIRAGDEGVSTVSVCVDTKGRITDPPTTANSSGFARLDEAALKLARAGTGHYRASTEDGKPVSSCYAFGVRFQLKK
jgi:TonB family protein